jgi:hypothetical protein
MLLLAYLAELSSERTKIPSVIILLFVGWFANEATGWLGWNIPDLHAFLPILGTIGLILIVLEGALDLKMNKSRLGIVKTTLSIAVLQMMLMAFIFTGLICWYARVPFITGLMNSLPLCVVSSSIAIPASKNSSPAVREFVIYESSFSDVLGVLFFNFVIFNIGRPFDISTLGLFFLQVILVILISIISVIGLSYLLSRIRNHVTYTPIILLAILIYAIAKEFDLSGLLFILVFGLFLGNITEFRNYYLIQLINTERMGHEINKFKSITIEATFIIRSLFFLVFGFLMETSDFINVKTLPMALGIVLIILGVRWVFLKIMKLNVQELLYFSPRGLITVLLFMSILPGFNIPLIDNSLIIQIIVISIIIMMFGLIRNRNKNLN